MRNNLIPNTRWGTEAAEDFNAGTTQQSMQCFTCAKEENDLIPAKIVFYNGTSYCLGHLPA